MKKMQVHRRSFVVFALVLMCMLGLIGCDGGRSSEQEEPTIAYSFYGSGDQISVSNGVIERSEAGELLDGGELGISQNIIEQDIVSYTASFYVMEDGEKSVFMSNNANSEAGELLNAPTSLGSCLGDNIVVGYGGERIDEVKGKLWFELSTTNAANETNTYRIRLSLTEVASFSS